MGMGRGTHFAGLVLRDFVLRVAVAVFAAAVGPPGFGDVDLNPMKPLGQRRWKGRYGRARGWGGVP